MALLIFSCIDIRSTRSCFLHWQNPHARGRTDKGKCALWDASVDKRHADEVSFCKPCKTDIRPSQLS